MAVFWKDLATPAAISAIVIASLFWIVTWSITTLRDQVVRYRPGQYIHHDVTARVTFDSLDPQRENEIRQAARESSPRVYRRLDGSLKELEARLLSLPRDVAAARPEQLPKRLRLDGGTITALKKIAESPPDQPGNPADYAAWVQNYIEQLRQARDAGVLVVLKPDERQRELRGGASRSVKIQGPGPAPEFIVLDVARIFAAPPRGDEALPQERRNELLAVIDPLASRNFQAPLGASIAGFTADTVAPTHELDPDLTAIEQEEAARKVSVAPARRHIVENTVLVPRGRLVTAEAWKLLADEQRAWVEQMRGQGTVAWLLGHAGMAAVAALFTVALAAYVLLFQQRIVRNHMRALALASLLSAMLLVAMLAGVGTGPLLLFAVAPTLLVAMTLSIAYDRRFAMGVSTLHALMVTVVLGQGAGFLLIAWVGAMACCALLDDIRSRSKPVEVGAASAVAMMAAAAAVSLVAGDPARVIGQNALHVGVAGLGVGFVILGILPFVERAFKITTSMTLLELADASQPLLRRLAMEAPGTYNHSLQVATLAEAAAESIGADSLLCRVGSYYHDIGKMNKADYFCENQFDGPNRHLNLTPSVSMLIIIGHVKDGVEMAREYNLPPALVSFIQEHHGTTLVEYFYHQACRQADATDPDAPPVPDAQYRYPGPRPQSRETVIVMIADAVESATRAMVGPTASRIESLVHDLVMARLLDGQFDESDITFAEIAQVERSLVKTLLSIYHGRLAYPSTMSRTHPGLAKTAS